MLLFCFRSKKVVQLRNEVIESLEMDRRREAEEDQVSIFRSPKGSSAYLNVN